MKVVRSDSVYSALNGGDGFERRVRRPRNLFRNLHRIDQAVDLRYRATVGLGRDVEIDFDAPHTSTLHVGDAHVDSGEPESRRQPLEPGLIETVVDERPDEHVARD